MKLGRLRELTAGYSDDVEVAIEVFDHKFRVLEAIHPMELYKQYGDYYYPDTDQETDTKLVLVIE